MPEGYDLNAPPSDPPAPRPKMPLVITTQLDGLRRYNKDLHTGIIYDECNLEECRLSRESQLAHLTLTGHEVEVHARYNNAKLPPGRSVIFTTNLRPERIIKFEYPEIRRRVQVVMVRGRKQYEPWPLDSDGPECSGIGKCPSEPDHFLFYRHKLMHVK